MILLAVSLLVGSAAAFAWTEKLKLERSPIVRPRFAPVFSPTCACRQRTARLALRLRRADTIDAVIVDGDGEVVRTIVSHSRRAPGRMTFHWDGTDDGGDVVPDGSYRLRLHFADERRTIVIPNVIHVDTHAPVVELMRLAPHELSPDGDGRNDRARIVFRVSESARPLILLDGTLAERGTSYAEGTGTLVWRGTADRRPLPAGPYFVTVQARDRAGNVSAPTEGTRVLIRYVEVARVSRRPRLGGVLRFRVLTDARHFRWTLFRLDGEGRALRGTGAAGTVAIRLPGRIRPGRYALRVSANGHGDHTAVFVRARR